MRRPIFLKCAARIAPSAARAGGDCRDACFLSGLVAFIQARFRSLAVGMAGLEPPDEPGALQDRASHLRSDWLVSIATEIRKARSSSLQTRV